MNSNSPGAAFLQHEFLVGDNRNWEQRMSYDKSIQVILKFEDLINGRDADAIVSHADNELIRAIMRKSS
ncbi:MAG TPA: hypothetical protein VIK39_08910 [Candidatus Angelobacter sp.]